jgi:hypothetical protein
MTDESQLITVFRSAEPSAEEEAAGARETLAKAGIPSIAVGDDIPGVIEGTWEVRVSADYRVRAEAILAAQPPEPEDEGEVADEAMSHELDFVNVFGSQAAGAEMEATMIQSLLDANGIPCVLIGSAPYPSLGFEVRVPKSRLEEAVALIEEARQSGAVVEGDSA